MTDLKPLTEQQLTDIERAVPRLTEYVEQSDAVRVVAEGAPALLAEVRRLRVTEAAATTVRALHKRRTERHGSGCVQCGIVWPCPTYLGLAPVGEHHVTEATR